jgi:hypothetical protein
MIMERKVSEEWTPIAEHLPPWGNDVWLLMTNGDIEEGYCEMDSDDDWNFHASGSDKKLPEPTHWQEK